MYHSKAKDCIIIIYFNAHLEISPDDVFFRFVDILFGRTF